MTDTERANTIARVAFVTPNAAILLNEYNALAKQVRKGGDQVRCFTPVVSRQDAADLDEQGIHCTQFSLNPEGFSLFPRARAIANLAGLIGEWKPSVIVAIGGPELVAAVEASKKLKTRPRTIAIIETLPETRREKAARPRNAPEEQSFKRALGNADCIVCLNATTPKILKLRALIADDTSVHVAPRCGVDIHAFDETPLPDINPGLVFHLSCPLEAKNGVLPYCAAASLLKKDAPNAKFVLSGPPGTSNDAIASEALKPFMNAIEHSTVRAPTKDDLSDCHVFVSLMPGETLPLNAAHALAIGRPLIAVNTPANRQFIDERVNGCLIETRDASTIAPAMASFLRRPDLIPAMARASRKKAVHRLDQAQMLAKLLPLLQLSR